VLDSLLPSMLALRRLLFLARRGTGRSAEPGVRSMRPDDLAAVMRIEEASFPDAWTIDVLYRFLANGASGHVLEREGRCVGFFLVGLAGDHLHLVNLAVAPEERRRGLATLALQKIEKIAWAYGLPRVELEVRETNLAAQLLYRRNGYRAVAILRSYYRDEDGYKMTKDVANLPGPRGARANVTRRSREPK
jgi:[ribosomal protein S18]-alanine N-acetyltransferase